MSVVPEIRIASAKQPWWAVVFLPLPPLPLPKNYQTLTGLQLRSRGSRARASYINISGSYMDGEWD